MLPHELLYLIQPRDEKATPSPPSLSGDDGPGPLDFLIFIVLGTIATVVAGYFLRQQ